MDEHEIAAVDAGIIELTMARVRPAGMVALAAASLGGLLGAGAAIFVVSVGVAVALEAQGGSTGNVGSMGAFGIAAGLALLYVTPVVPLVVAVLGTLQGMRVRSIGWARAGAVALIVSGALMPLTVGLGTYCVGLCPSLAYAVVALPTAGYVLGVLSDPQVRLGFELAAKVDAEADRYPR